MIVLDASAVLELLLRTERGKAAEARVFAPGATVHAPELVDLEVLQVLRRYVRTGEVKPARADQALQDLADLPLERYFHAITTRRIWELRENLTAYDAAYVALAELLDAPLLTCDGRIARAPHRARVELLDGPEEAEREERTPDTG